MRCIASSILFSALAAAFSLSSLEPVSKSELTPECFKAYDAEIEACADGPCSEDCTNAVPEISEQLRESCADDFVGMDSLLRRTLDGGLAERLCAVEDTEEDKHESYRIVLSTLEAPALTLQAPAMSTTIYAPAATAVAGEDEEDSASIFMDPLESSPSSPPATITPPSTISLEFDTSVPTTLSSLFVPSSVFAASASASSSVEPSQAPESSGASRGTPLTALVVAVLSLTVVMTW